MNDWWWVIGGFFVIWIIGSAINDAQKSWHLRSLSPTQRKIVELKLESWKVNQSKVNINLDELRALQRTEGKLAAEISQLFDTLTEAQANEVHRAYGKVWRYNPR